MPITLKKLNAIRDDLKKRKLTALSRDPDAPLTNRQAVHQLAPVLFRLKKRGFKTKELADLLKEHGLGITPATLNRYLDEYRADKKATVATTSTVNILHEDSDSDQ